MYNAIMESTLFTPKYKQALELVADLFKDKNRDISGLPYIVHLAGVSRIVSGMTDDEDVIIAGLLHDVLEDIDPSIYGEMDMRRDFGDKITDIVKTVSHDEIKYTKKESREKYLEQIKNGSLEACLVSGADLLHNSGDIVYLYDKMPNKVKAEFGGERAERRAWFYGSRYEIFKTRLGDDHKLIRDLKPVMARLAEIHAQIL